MQRHLHAPAESQPSLFGKRYFAKLRTGKHTAGFGSQGRERRDNQVSSCFQADSLHRSWDSPRVLHPHIPAEPQGTLPATLVPGSTGGPGTAWLSRDGDSLPTQELGVLGAIHPRAGKPLHTRGNSEAARTQPVRIYTSSMTTPLPFVLPTGWDFNHRFPPKAGGRAGSMRLNIHSAHPPGTRHHPPSSPAAHVRFYRGKPSLQLPRTPCTMLSRALKARWDLQKFKVLS